MADYGRGEAARVRELCRRLKGDPRTHDVPVILLLRNGSDADSIRAVRAGADDVC